MLPASEITPALPVIVHPPLQPCRFCGETEHFLVHPGYEAGWRHAADGSLIRGADGEPLMFEEDFVECQICDATAPVAIWNGHRRTAEERAAIIAGWAEYGDDYRWIGAAQ